MTNEPTNESARQRFERLYAEGPQVGNNPLQRLAVLWTHRLRKHQRNIDIALLDVSDGASQASAMVAAEVALSREEAKALGDRAADEFRLVREELRSTADASSVSLRRMDELADRLGVALALNDETSVAVDRLHEELSTTRDENAALRQDVVRSLGNLTEELARTTRQLAHEVADLREEVLRQRVEADFAYNELTALPHTTLSDGLRVVGDDGSERIGFKGGWRSPPLYVGFESVFRGDESFVAERQRAYVELLAGSPPVVDLGAGRGEILGLLASAGVPAVGVDTDPDMTDAIWAKGLRAECVDAFEYLEKQPDESVGAVFSAQFIEHLGGREVIELVRLSWRKLVPGGLFVAETVNPHSPRALKAFWVDLTHSHPIFPETLVVWCGLAGFPEATIRFPLGGGDLDEDLRTQGEYAVVARKAD